MNIWVRISMIWKHTSSCCLATIIAYPPFSSISCIMYHCACPHIQLAYTSRIWLTTPVMGRLQVAGNALSDYFPARYWVHLATVVQWKYLYITTNSLYFIHNNFTYKFISICCRELCISYAYQSEQFKMENTQSHYQ